MKYLVFKQQNYLTTKIKRINIKLVGKKKYNNTNI